MGNTDLAESLTDDELLEILGISAEEFDEIYRADMSVDELVAAIAQRRGETR
jgi:hypothetical protein